MPRSLVLASASPARAGLLAAAGVDVAVRVSGVDERALEAALPRAAPRVLAGALARAKAAAVATALVAEGSGDVLVLGCDSVLDLDGEALGRPEDAGDARRRWQRLRGREAVLQTGHALLSLRAGHVAGAAEATAGAVVRFGRPTDAEIDAYVATGEPLQVAGSFTLDGYGGWFVDGVDGSPSTVVGLSLPLLRVLSAELGVAVVDLWRAAPTPAADDGRLRQQ